MELDDDDYFARNETLRYNVRLLIRHPSIDPNIITRTLQLTPHLSAMAGSFRTTPKGEVLRFRHRESIWSHLFQVDRNRFFSKASSI